MSFICGKNQRSDNLIVRSLGETKKDQANDANLPKQTYACQILIIYDRTLSFSAFWDSNHGQGGNQRIRAHRTMRPSRLHGKRRQRKYHSLDSRHKLQLGHCWCRNAMLLLPRRWWPLMTPSSARITWRICWSTTALMVHSKGTCPRWVPAWSWTVRGFWDEKGFLKVGFRKQDRDHARKRPEEDPVEEV